jgi:Xaa-Pro aminopeptidase
MTRNAELRLESLRGILKHRGLDGFIIPRADEHLGEYVAECAQRLAFISGFTGSAGLAIVLADRAAIFSDGRYTLQLEQETDGAHWQRLHITETPPDDWLRGNAVGLRIGYDPWLISADGLKKFAGVAMVAVAGNPIDEIWSDRPAPPMSPALPHDVVFAGAEAAEKRHLLAKDLREQGQDAAILSDPASVAWLFNLRGGDVEFTPVALSYAILNADATATLFIASAKLSGETRSRLGNEVTVIEPDQIESVLAGYAGKTVRYDPAGMPVWFKTTLESAGARIAEGTDPVALPRAKKNVTEQAGARAAHLRDGVAMVRFLAWLAKNAKLNCETEMSAAEKLLAFRAMGARFRGESFPAISGAGEHGAVIHYRVSPESNRRINPNEVFLIDSGGQYSDGTTDITRTVWTGPDPAPADIRANFTRVLAGNIALGTAVFPEGVTGAHLDALARTALWQAGLDYDHGTGHGVGSYLSVHEGPAGISRAAKPVPLASGMILSNEPGYYLPGSYGIRLETLVMVEPAAFPDSRRKFLQFETLTLAPFDRALIEPAILTDDAKNWLNQYHLRVRDLLSPFLTGADDADALGWLREATAPI